MKLFTTLFWTLLSLSLWSQSFDKGKMDQFFDHIEKHDKAMGVISIYQDGEEVYSRALGMRDTKENLQANASTKYRIGSITKTFTAAMMMQLVEEGKVDLSSKLSEYFNSIPNANKITIEHLLRHRSGLYNITDAPEYKTYNTTPKTQEELLNIIASYEPEFSPGERMRYCNSGYLLLTFILEEIEELSYREILEKRITKPFRLKNTYVGSAIDISNNEAHSFESNDGWKKYSETDMSIPLGAGAIVSTAADINRFYHLLMAEEIVSVESVEKMTTMKDGYGLGLFQFPFYDKYAFGHNGGIDAFVSTAGHFTDEGLGVCLLTNGLAMSSNDIMIGVLSIYFGKDYEFPVFTDPVNVPAELLKEYEGMYSAPEFPMKINIKVEKGRLTAQATDQPPIPMDAFAEDKFRFDPAGIILEFNAADNSMIIKQSGMTINMKRQ